MCKITADSDQVTMAVKQQPTDSPQQSGGGQQQQQQKATGKEIDIDELLCKIEEDSANPDKIPLGTGIVKYCEDIILALGKVTIPNEPSMLKQCRAGIEQVVTFFDKISKGDHHNEILTHCLKTVYISITNQPEPSFAMSVVLDMYDESFVNHAIKWILRSDDRGDDQDVKRAVNVLCKWLRCAHFVDNIHLWVNGILHELRETGQSELLLEISLQEIQYLFLSTLIPVARLKVAPVFLFILKEITNTPQVFHKILPKFPNFLNKLRSEKTQVNPASQAFVRNLVDTVDFLMQCHPGYDELYKPAKIVMDEYMASMDYKISDSTPWMDNLHNKLIKVNERVGLSNLGNTCYMNSVIQALVMTKQFSRDVLLMKNKTTLFSKLQQLLALLVYSQRHELTPRNFLNVARPTGFLLGHQQDSSEFLGHLLEALHEQEKAHIVNDIRHEQFSDVMSHESSVDSCHTDGSCEGGAHAIHHNQSQPAANIQPNHSAPVTMIQRTFGGNLSVVYKCLTCQTESKHTDIFRDLQLSFPASKSDVATNYSVQDLLDFYCTSEKLDGDNKYFCEKCNALSDGERYINILRAPRNLILTLKHFKYDQQFQQRAKLMHKVFHDETINLKVMSDGPPPQQEIQINYELYAAVVHSGISMDSGHYYTYASDHPNQWYTFNDNYVSTCSISELHNLSPPNTPYILFYQMVSTNVSGVDGAAIMPANSLVQNASNSSVVAVEKVPLPRLNELPVPLRNYVERDMMQFMEEQRNKNQNVKAFPPIGRNRYRDNDNDDPPPSNCGGNALNFVNEFIY